MCRRLGARKEALAKHRDQCLKLVPAEPVVADVEVPHVPHPSDDPGPPRTTKPDRSAGPRAPLTKPPRRTSREPGGPVEISGESRGPDRSAGELQAADGRVLRPLPDPGRVESQFQRRALTIADRMALGQWDRQAGKELAAQWGVTPDAVREYAQAAGVCLAADRGALEQQREVSLAYCQARRADARSAARRATEAADDAARTADEADELGDRVGALMAESKHRKIAVDMLKVELAWHELADKVAGVLAPAAPGVNVNVLSIASDPLFEQLMGKVLGALADMPEAHERVVSAVRAEIEARRGKRGG